MALTQLSAFPINVSQPSRHEQAQAIDKLHLTGTATYPTTHGPLTWSSVATMNCSHDGRCLT